VRLLLDTQVALWWLTASPRLAKASRELVAGSSCIVSVVSIWEVDLKHRLGKLSVPPARFRDEMRAAGAAVLSLTDQHVLTPIDLPRAHSDPFDRLLLSVAVSERLTLLTADETLIAFGTSDPRLPVRGV
jgi:PIN domain nuclease of toxin-antitoxin system